MKVTREQSKYPYYGKTKDGVVVYFTEPRKGVIVKAHTDWGSVGDRNTDFCERNFTPIPNPFEEEKFEPITITLETEEEAKAMWAKLNVPSEQATKYATQEGVNVSQATCFDLFNEFDEVFDPTK